MDVPEDNYDANRLSLLLKTGGKVVKEGPISPHDAIKRRFKRVLARFTIWSILFAPGGAPGLGLLSFER